MGLKRKYKASNSTNNKNKSNQNSQKSKLIAISVIIAVVSIGIIGFMTTYASNNIPNNNSLNQNLIGNWMDVHGIGLLPTDNGVNAMNNNDISNNNNSLYLATHHGLFKKDVGDSIATSSNINSSTSSSSNNNSNGSGGSGWMQVGNDKSDLMGFAINPAAIKQGIMYSSGHPPTGGNLGFRISEDYGVTWQKVSDVTMPTPIDFHTMTVGNNPEIIYAASGRGDNIFISSDGGKNWSIATSSPNGQQVITLAANQSNSNIVYAATTGGLFTSTDQGKNWQKINSELFESGNSNSTNTMVTGIEISPDGKTAYAFVAPNQDDGNKSGYIIKSTDGAKTWTKTDGQINGAVFVSKFAFGNDGEIYTALIQDSPQIGVAASVFSSNDDGKTWKLEGTNNKSLTTY